MQVIFFYIDSENAKNTRTVKQNKTHNICGFILNICKETINII